MTASKKHPRIRVPQTDATYERLSAMDSSFLHFEGPNTPMHVGGTVIFDAGPLVTAEGGVDIKRIHTHIASRLHVVPRYRQRLAYVPVENAPVWVDDVDFNLKYHIRHTSLPRPGTERQLKRLCGQLMAQPLDRRKPLWELWIVEGLKGGRFALVGKTHHCMVDGISSVDLLAALLRPTPDETIEEPPAWTPRRAPSAWQLLRDAVARHADTSVKLVQSLDDALQEPEKTSARLAESLGAVWETINAGLQPAANTPFNQPLGPHRRFDWLALDLADVKAVKNQLGGTVNDVVLATVAGAVRRFLQHRRVKPDAVAYRVAIPVSTRPPEEYGTMGNRVSAWLIDLPIEERDPRRRLARVRAETAALKESKQAQGFETLIQLAEWTGSVPLAAGARLASWMQPFNLVVSNVPGPQLPLYLLGAHALKGYPLLPLFENQCLGVAVLSYMGKLCWGVNADWDRIPDLNVFIAAIRRSFEELCEVAKVATIGRKRMAAEQPIRAAGGQR
jgi:WS/DGAT/MGAT family acyltransferase